MDNKTAVTIEVSVHAPLEKVWDMYTQPEHVTKWNHASDDWHSPRAENNLRVGGMFNYRMEAKDGSFGFDFSGTYTEVRRYEHIAYVMSDDRKVGTSFAKNDGDTKVVVIFDPEDTNPVEMQRQGWQAILDNFKKYVETATNNG